MDDRPRDRADAASNAVVEATAWIDAYLAALPAAQRSTLQSLRETIAAAAPDAVEAVSYGLPGFRYRGRALIWYLAAKAHCSLFPTSAVIDAHRAELADFELSKGTIRFTPDRPLPDGLVVRLVRERLTHLNADAVRKP